MAAPPLSCVSVANLCFCEADWCGNWEEEGDLVTEEEGENDEGLLASTTDWWGNCNSEIDLSGTSTRRSSVVVEPALLYNKNKQIETPSPKRKRRASLDYLATRKSPYQAVESKDGTKGAEQQQLIVADGSEPESATPAVIQQQSESEKSSALRQAMILTMLSSGDHRTAQAGAEAAANGSPIIVNPYQVLQVRRDATPSEIRHAYRRLALWHHPGRCCAAASAQERNRRLQVFEILAASYETLVDKETRGRCDHLLREKYTQFRRSKNIPLGQVCVGGKLLQPSASAENSNNGVDSTPDQNFMARVIGRLSMHRRVASLAETTDDDISTLGRPPLEPVSSDSSLAAETHEDLSDCSSVDDVVSVHQPSTAMSPRIHMPLGTPLGTPRRTGHGTPESHFRTSTADGPPIPLPGRQQSFLSITGACGMEALTSIDSHTAAVPGLMSSVSTVEPLNKQGEMHYTEGETNRLFGGPLQLLFRARRWKPFRDPLDVFADVFGSRVPLGPASPPAATTESNEGNVETASGAAATPPAPPTDVSSGPLLLPASHSSAGWTGSSETLADGTMLFHTSRILHNRRMTRTERVFVDPRTGQRHSKVTVTSELLDAQASPATKDDEKDEDNPADDDGDKDSFWDTCGEALLCGCADTTLADDDTTKEGMGPSLRQNDENSMPNTGAFCGSGLSWL